MKLSQQTTSSLTNEITIMHTRWEESLTWQTNVNRDYTASLKEWLSQNLDWLPTHSSRGIENYTVNPGTTRKLYSKAWEVTQAGSLPLKTETLLGILEKQSSQLPIPSSLWNPGSSAKALLKLSVSEGGSQVLRGHWLSFEQINCDDDITGTHQYIPTLCKQNYLVFLVELERKIINF